jgi:hypothetical protein
MKRISAIAISLLLIIGLTAEAQAVTSGVYRCYVHQGSFDNRTSTTPLIFHYNPNATGGQSITRVRIFDHLGGALFDQSFAPGNFTVNGRGSTFVITAISGVFEGLQVIVNWKQAVDAAPPIPRLTLYHISGGGIVTSEAQSTCP